MKLIELHILQSFPVTCLNRDDVGAPKSAVFGGVQRARVSSQCWKRTIRQMMIKEQPKIFGGKRTRYVIEPLKSIFQKKGKNAKEAEILAVIIADTLGKLDSLKKGNVKTLLYFSEGEIEHVADAMLQMNYASDLKVIVDEKSKDKEKANKKLSKLAEKAAKSLKEKVKDAADISIFGRMVADDHTLMLEGAGLFSHALSTHKVSNEIDFFSALDDSKPEDIEGAGHLGTLEFNSACYYRYIGLNLDLLTNDHLKHLSDKELKTVVKTFLRSSILAVPEARKNSMHGFSLPSYVLGFKREGQPLSLANAFETPVKSSGGYIEESKARLNKHYQELDNSFCLNIQKKSIIPEQNLETFINGLME